MSEHAPDADVVTRSMATTRGHLGGLALRHPPGRAPARRRWVPLVRLETVGVGQVEVEVAGAADTTLVVVNPGWGDAVQASKAGLIEVADVIVVTRPIGRVRTRLVETWSGCSTSLDPPNGRRMSHRRVGARRSSPRWQRRARASPSCGTPSTLIAGMPRSLDCSSAAALRGSTASSARSSPPPAPASSGAVRRGALAELTAAVVDRRVDPWTAAEEMISPALRPR